MARKKTTRRRKNEITALVRLPDGKKTVSVESLVELIERRLDSDDDQKAFEEQVANYRPGTVGAAKLVTAADALEDEDLLLDLVRKGFLEALRSHTMRRRISDEVQRLIESGVLDEVASNQAAVGWSSADDQYPGAWMIAEFGDSIAANGTLLADDDKVPERPKDFVLTNHGGVIPETAESVHPTAITSMVIEGLGLQPDDDVSKIVLEALIDEFPDGIGVQVSGQTEIWMEGSSIDVEQDFDASYTDR